MYVSIICCISRLGSEDRIYHNLKNILTDDEYEFVFMVDNNKFSILRLQRTLEKLPHNVRNITILKSGKAPPSAFNMTMRRTRISDNHNQIKEALGASQFVFGFEDDTILPEGALNNLIADFKDLDNPGLIEGVQVGRWGNRYIGAWTVDDINTPTRYMSLKPGDGLEEIDGSGFYCFLTPTSLYKAHEFKWNEPLGPDVEYSLSLRQQGYQNYIDWGVQTMHDTPQGILTVDPNIASLKLTNEGRWL